ncbi:AraC family transcriptional regulator [Marichromatium gracile]|uniref:AraC family transcriptional regulator n=1 Tax=Marichromatium gracile TaxID=1048 RepID=UPI001F3DE0EE|nr:helix-turn-helix domain-containing protein [Marichromatium gracile]MCF1184625.1 AraC family transcriptional regulator [Marichromatium gracile]
MPPSTPMSLSTALPSQQPVDLIENRTLFARHAAELSIYDTFAPARDVPLRADELLYCAMTQGRKRMHGPHPAHDFLPHQSYVLAPGEQVLIDFPEATLQRPTRCLTIAVERERLRRLCDRLDRHAPLPRGRGSWQTVPRHSWHGHHSVATQRLLERIAGSFLQADADNDLVLDHGVDELLGRLLRQQGREFLLACAAAEPDHDSFSAVLDHIERHLAQPLDVERLCRLSCMSRTRFYARFAALLGCTPNAYLLERRLRRAAALLDRGMAVTRVAYEVGFQSPSHFSRRFQARYGVAPSRYRAHAAPPLPG